MTMPIIISAAAIVILPLPPPSSCGISLSISVSAWFKLWICCLKPSSTGCLLSKLSGMSNSTTCWRVIIVRFTFLFQKVLNRTRLFIRRAIRRKSAVIFYLFLLFDQLDGEEDLLIYPLLPAKDARGSLTYPSTNRWVLVREAERKKKMEKGKGCLFFMPVRVCFGWSWRMKIQRGVRRIQKIWT